MEDTPVSAVEPLTQAVQLAALVTLESAYELPGHKPPHAAEE